MAIASGLIIAIILLKYKPIYKVTLAGQEMGYVENGTEKDASEQSGDHDDWDRINGLTQARKEEIYEHTR